jgi:hypothetical protein
MRASIVNSILNWADGAQWEDPDRAERVFEKLAEAPEKFISPNPETCGSYREEASRIYEEIKEEYGLRTETDLARERRDYERKCDDRLREEIREQIETFGLESVRQAVESYDPDVPPACRERVESVLASEPVDVYYPGFEHFEQLDPESGDLPEPTPEPDPEPVETATGADPTDVRAAVESVESAAADGETEPTPADDPDPAPDPETAPAGSGEVSLGRTLATLAGRRAAAGLRRVARILMLAAAVLAPVIISWSKGGARVAGRVTAFSLRLTLATLAFTLKLVFALCVGFCAGLLAVEGGR